MFFHTTSFRYQTKALIATLLFLASIADVSATPESRAGALFLLISPSTRVNGMGQAGVALPDEPGGYYNPGAASLASPSQTLQTRFYLGEMKWLPGLNDDLTYSYSAAQVGMQRQTPWAIGGENTSIRTVLYGYRTKFDLGEQTRTDERGNTIGTFSSADKANQLGLSIAILSIIDVGVGVTAKRINTDFGSLDASTNAYDFGFLTRVPVIRIFEKAIGGSLVIQNHIRPVFEGTFGVAWRNRGGNKLNYGSNGGADPLPANRSQGWSSKFGLNWTSDQATLDIVSARFIEERYQPQIEGAESSAFTEDHKSGLELSLLETIDFRRGEYNDDDGELHLDTDGITIRSDGIFKLLSALLSSAGESSEVNALLFLADHLSIRWSKFEYEDKGFEKSYLAGISHAQIGFSF